MTAGVSSLVLDLTSLVCLCSQTADLPMLPSLLDRGKYNGTSPLLGHGNQDTLEMEQCATFQSGRQL